MNAQGSRATFTQQAAESGISVRYEESTTRLTQKLLAELFGVSVPTDSEHLTIVVRSR